MSATFKCGENRYIMTIESVKETDKEPHTLSSEIYEQLVNPSEIVETYFLQS